MWGEESDSAGCDEQRSAGRQWSSRGKRTCMLVEMEKMAHHGFWCLGKIKHCSNPAERMTSVSEHKQSMENIHAGRAAVSSNERWSSSDKKDYAGAGGVSSGISEPWWN